MLMSAIQISSVSFFKISIQHLYYSKFSVHHSLVPDGKHHTLIYCYWYLIQCRRRLQMWCTGFKIIIFPVLLFSWMAIPPTSCISFSSSTDDHCNLKQSPLFDLPKLFYNYMGSHSALNGNKKQQRISPPRATKHHTYSTDAKHTNTPLIHSSRLFITELFG